MLQLNWENHVKWPKKYFYKTNQTEINIEKLYKNIDLKMALNKIDYERACNDQFQKIYELIRDLL